MQGWPYVSPRWKMFDLGLELSALMFKRETLIELLIQSFAVFKLYLKGVFLISLAWVNNRLLYVQPIITRTLNSTLHMHWEKHCCTISKCMKFILQLVKNDNIWLFLRMFHKIDYDIYLVPSDIENELKR